MTVILEFKNMENTKINPSKKHHTSVDGNRCNLVRIKTYPIDFIFDFIRNNPMSPDVKPWAFNKQPGAFYVDEEGNKCKLRRARIFYEIGIDCVKCNTKAKFFALELWPDKSLHFELYGVDEAGDEVLMTIDHIQAKSNGGENHPDNYDPMCKCCNEKKSNL